MKGRKKKKTLLDECDTLVVDHERLRLGHSTPKAGLPGRRRLKQHLVLLSQLLAVHAKRFNHKTKPKTKTKQKKKKPQRKVGLHHLLKDMLPGNCLCGDSLVLFGHELHLHVQAVKAKKSH